VTRSVEPMSAVQLRFGVTAVWLLASGILLSISRHAIIGLTMWDADDYLRLQEVRDLLAGQSFFDVTQYRIDPPAGVPMHWSRIADLPLAGLMLLLRPLFGTMLAERVTVSLEPLLILGGSLSAAALIASRLADRRTALIAAMLGSAAPLMLFHVLPLRIDHHGLQTMIGLFAIAACLRQDAIRGGLLAGCLAALWLAVSLEGLPMVAALAALLGIGFVGGGCEASVRFRGFCAALSLAGAVLFALLHAPGAYRLMYCDAVGPAWAGPMALSPALVALLLPFVAHRGVAARVSLLAIAAAAGVALLALTAPACLDGPFAALDPLVRYYWYDNVPEGLPVWRQPIDNAVLLAGFPLVGIAGCLLGWAAAKGRARRDWLLMLALLFCAYAVGLMVQRAGAFAHAVSLPGAAYLLARLLDRIGQWHRAIVRIFASALAIAALSPVGAMAIGDLALSRSGTDKAGARPVRPICTAPCDDFTALRRLPRASILAGLDITPRLLVETPHSYAGSGHHRGRDGIHRVIASFIGDPAIAHRLMIERHMDYVLIEPNGNESAIYGKAAPNGLMARLLGGRPPSWLKPLPLPGSHLLLWQRVG